MQMPAINFAFAQLDAPAASRLLRLTASSAIDAYQL